MSLEVNSSTEAKETFLAMNEPQKTPVNTPVTIVAHSVFEGIAKRTCPAQVLMLKQLKRTLIVHPDHFSVVWRVKMDTIVIRPEYPAVVVVLEGYSKAALTCFGAVYLTKKESTVILKDLLENWKIAGGINKLSATIIIPMETIKPYSDILTNVVNELKAIKIVDTQRMFPFCPEKINIRMEKGKSVSTIYMTDV